MTLRTGEDILIWRSRLWIALCGGIVLEEALDLSSDRILNGWMNVQKKKNELSKERANQHRGCAEFVPRGQLVNKVLPGSLSTFEGCCAQEEAWNVGKPDLDVAPRQCGSSRVAPHLQYLAKHQTSVVPYPPYSPHLATADFFLFPKLKTTLKGRRFQTTRRFRKIR